MNILNLKTWYNRNHIHIKAWFFFILYDAFITGLITQKWGTFENYFLHYLLNISLFYFHAAGIRKILSRNFKYKIWLILPFVALELLIYYSLAYPIDYLVFIVIDHGDPNKLIFNSLYVLRVSWRAIYFIGFSTGYVFLLNSVIERKRVQKLERQNLVDTIEKQALENDLVQSQNNFLRSQINPHFLFNTLNFIYNDARKKAPLAADAIMNLSEMMRYALKRPEASELVPLSEEVEQIEHLINLHKLRTANTINFNLEIEGDLFGIRFPPLILLTLVENMFKHGNIAHSTQPSIVKINYDKTSLSITTINMINEVKKKELESHHVGLENIDKRLNNFFKDKYSFKFYKDDINRYFTEIKVEIDNPLAGLN
ncbi:sensor histidine kinase [Pedobacter jejuensis]|uniref:Histidine kinase n=1 Tax=Pedobacter jejuensis TaxID=1268550 RepID=A0A3N0BZ98_9SPHI|nr:sensor histidine kinase [Pedobacter jejuensis]RNL55052.1 histidine kinase [Pedobacter jejuensis]